MPPIWKSELALAYRLVPDLLQAIGLGVTYASSPFPLLCTRHYAGKIRPVADDPLLRMVLPTEAENAVVPGFGDDPVGDSQALVEPGMLHKYKGRLLLVSTGECAIHCRFCFRRNYPYGTSQAYGLPARLAARLAQDSSIDEVILSGGDPLLLDDAALAALLEAAAQPHIKRVRIHSRTPLTLPSRFTPELYALLARLGSRLVFVLHADHPRELDEASKEIAIRLRTLGAHLFNQSVLLAGVNDSASVLAELSENLFAQGYLPYYLHQLDRVRGAAHFEVPETRAKALVAELRELLPGYLVPLWVRENAGALSKTPL